MRVKMASFQAWNRGLTLSIPAQQLHYQSPSKPLDAAPHIGKADLSRRDVATRCLFWGAKVAALDLAGKTAMVTGAGTGIGAAIAKALADAGANVACTDLDQRAAESIASAIGGRAAAFALDVTDSNAIAAIVDKVTARFGGLDIVCANAGVSTMNPVVDLTENEWDFNMNVNAKGVFLTNQAAVRHFINTGTKGVIVNTASLAAKIGAPLLAHYSASKFAVLGFTQALAPRSCRTRHPRELRLSRLRQNQHAAPGDCMGGEASWHERGGGAR